MRLMFSFGGVIAALLLIPGAALADGPGDTDPAAVVLDYAAALLRLDADAAAALACPFDPPELPDFAAALDRRAALDYSVDPSELAAEIVQSGTGWAWVRVSGGLAVHVAGLDETATLAPADLGLDSLWAVWDEDRWAVCARPPDTVIVQLGPDAAARLFLNAAFSGDYALAHGLICAERQGAFSEAQYQAAFGEMIAQGVRVDLGEAVFDITDQTDHTATVTLSGQAAIHWDDLTAPLAVEAAQIGGSPIALVYETGWKVCASR